MTHLFHEILCLHSSGTESWRAVCSLEIPRIAPCAICRYQHGLTQYLVVLHSENSLGFFLQQPAISDGCR